MVGLVTGCAATRNGVDARLFRPVTTNEHVPDPEGVSVYQPARSPAFSDPYGG